VPELSARRRKRFLTPHAARLLTLMNVQRRTQASSLRQSKKALAKRDRKLIAAALESAKQAIKGESSRHKDVAADRARLLDFQGPQPHEVSDDIKALVWGNIYSKTEV